MKYVHRTVVLVSLCAVVALTSGCMGLSLFTTHHTHYHGGAELREEVESMNKRLDDLEKQKAVPQPDA